MSEKLDLYYRRAGYTEAAEFIGVKRGTLYSWVSRNRIPFIRYGPRCVRFDLDELQRWIDEHKFAPTGREKQQEV